MQAIYFHKTERILNKTFEATACINIENGKIEIKGDYVDSMGMHEAYPPQSINDAIEILTDLGYKEMYDINHLRDWFMYEIDKELSFRGIETKLGLASTTLDKFVKRGRGLGAKELTVFEWALKRGYNPTYQYNPII